MSEPVGWDEVQLMLTDCEQRSEKMNDWELKFIDDMTIRLARGGTANDNQLAKLTEIWEKVTS
jgi:hypothetical protein